jgi:Na+/H+ antiporter NhaA
MVLVLMDVVPDELSEPDSAGIHLVANEVPPFSFLVLVFFPDLSHGALVSDFLHGVEALECAMLAIEPSLSDFVEELIVQIFLLSPVAEVSREFSEGTISTHLRERGLGQGSARAIIHEVS